VAEESIVLLKNDASLLPLAPRVKSVAVIGPLADDKIAALGSWPGRGDPKDAVTPLEGIKQRAGGGSVSVVYEKGCGITDTATAVRYLSITITRTPGVRPGRTSTRPSTRTYP